MAYRILNLTKNFGHARNIHFKTREEAVKTARRFGYKHPEKVVVKVRQKKKTTGLIWGGTGKW